jgi:hypothetical protein
VAVGDVILSINDQTLASIQDAKRLAEGPPETLCRLYLQRFGEPEQPATLILMREPVVPEDSGRVFEVANLPQASAALGARVTGDPGGRGMLVCGIHEGASAYWSDLKLGDIITDVDGTRVVHATPEDMVRLTSGPTGSRMLLRVIRARPVDNALGITSMSGIDVADREMLVTVRVVRCVRSEGDSLAAALGYRRRLLKLLHTHINHALHPASPSTSPSRTNNTPPLRKSTSPPRAYQSLPPHSTLLSPREAPAQSYTSSSVHTSSHRPASPGRGDSYSYTDSVHKSNNNSSKPPALPTNGTSHYSHSSSPPRHQSPPNPRRRDEQATSTSASSSSYTTSATRDESYTPARINSAVVNGHHNSAYTDSRSSPSSDRRTPSPASRRVTGDSTDAKRTQPVPIDGTRHVPSVLASQAESVIASPSLHQHLRELSARGGNSPWGGGPEQMSQQRAWENSEVGVSLTLEVSAEKPGRLIRDIIATCAWCVGTSEDRFDYCGMDQGPNGTVIVRLNVRKADPTHHTDTRPPSTLAQNLLAQLSHPFSPLHTAPASKTTSDVVVSKPFQSAPLPSLEADGHDRGLAGLSTDPAMLSRSEFDSRHVARNEGPPLGQTGYSYRAGTTDDPGLDYAHGGQPGLSGGVGINLGEDGSEDEDRQMGYVRVCVIVHVFVCSWLYLCVYSVCAPARSCEPVYVSVCVCVCVCVCIHIYIIYIHILYIYILYVYIYIYSQPIHTHIFT